MHRSATSQSCRRAVSIPIPIQQIENRKQTLINRKQTRSGHRSLSAFKQVSTPFRETGATFNRQHNSTKSFSAQQFKKPIGFLNKDFNTTQNKFYQKVSIDRHSIPLRLLNIQKLTQEDTLSRNFPTSNIQHRRRQFLKKGTAINKAIMFNVLKTKYNKNIVDSSSSYVNHPSNDMLGAAVYDQVPKGLRDVVGTQQMLRMSNIFTGGSINSINIHRKVNQIIQSYHKTRQQPVQEEEGMTLKSIKRW